MCTTEPILKLIEDLDKVLLVVLLLYNILYVCVFPNIFILETKKTVLNIDSLCLAVLIIVHFINVCTCGLDTCCIVI